jgi:mono/diheme cytochrome c family protein
MDRAKAKRAVVFVVGGFLGLVLVVGCYRAGQVPSLNWKGLGVAAAAPDQFATAKVVFGRNCARCHSIGGSRAPSAGPGETMKGPDLGRVGADPSHTRQWLMDTIRDPQAQDRRARMPRFEGKLSEGDLLALADYLTSLKGN